MKDYILYIDDTGFNVREKTSTTLRNENGTYVAVLIPTNNITYLEEFMKNACNVLYARFNTCEFHFTDIYNRRNEFKNIDIEETLDIIDMFAEVYEKCDLKIFVHTVNNDPKSDTMIQLETAIDQLLKTMNIDATDKSQALIMSYLKAKKYADNIQGTITKIICDEGLRKNGAVAKCNDFSIHFYSSKDCQLLQLADFAAWFVTRVKHILDKAVTKHIISDIDKAVLEEYSYLTDNFIGLTKEKINLNDFTDFSYDNVIERHKQKIDDENKP